MNDFSVPRFETIDDVQRLQDDLLRLLGATSVEPRQYAALAHCRPDHCALANCAEACWFGTRRRRLKELLAAYRLIANSKGPVCEVRIIRAGWGHPIGRLRDADILLARQWNRRALDSLHFPGLVAVGLFKASLPSEQETPYWITEVHEITAGAQKEKLEQAFPKERWDRNPQDIRKSDRYLELERSEEYYQQLEEAFEYQSLTRVAEVNHVGPSLNRIFNRELHSWQDVPRTIPNPRPAKRAYRAEYYRWLLDLPLDARLIRYGCDRYFNKIGKQARLVRPKIRKKRPYPYWLERYMFGNHPYGCTCRGCTG